MFKRIFIAAVVGVPVAVLMVLREMGVRYKASMSTLVPNDHIIYNRLRKMQAKMKSTVKVRLFAIDALDESSAIYNYFGHSYDIYIPKVYLTFSQKEPDLSKLEPSFSVKIEEGVDAEVRKKVEEYARLRSKFDIFPIIKRYKFLLAHEIAHTSNWRIMHIFRTMKYYVNPHGEELYCDDLAAKLYRLYGLYFFAYTSFNEFYLPSVFPELKVDLDLGRGWSHPSHLERAQIIGYTLWDILNTPIMHDDVLNIITQK